MLGTGELVELEDAIKENLEEHLTETLARLNRTGQLESFLRLLKLEALLDKKSEYQSYKTGKIVVIGQTEVKPDVFYAISKKLGIDKERLELYLDYKTAKNFNFRKLQWQPTYSLIMVGPMPHSGEEKGGFGSIIAAVEQTDGYPPVVRLGTNELKITKSNFRSKLQEMLETRKILATEGA